MFHQFLKMSVQQQDIETEQDFENRNRFPLIHNLPTQLEKIK